MRKGKYIIEIFSKKGIFDAKGEMVTSDIKDLGIKTINYVQTAQLYYFTGKLSKLQLKVIAEKLLTDPVTQKYKISRIVNNKVATERLSKLPPTSRDIRRHGRTQIDVWFKPGVTDAVGESVVKAIKDMGIEGMISVKTGNRYTLYGHFSRVDLNRISTRILSNTVVQEYRVE